MTPPHLLTCIGTEDDLPLLPHFLRHYLALGVPAGRIAPILQASRDDAPGLGAARAVLAAFGVAPAETWIGPYTSGAMWERRRALQARVADRGDWVLNADVDELHAYPAPLAAVIAWLDGQGATCLQGPMIDRLAPGGALNAVAPEPELAAQFPLSAEVMLRIGAGQLHNAHGSVKMMLHRAEVLPSRGGHAPVDPAAARFAHGRPLASFRRIADPAFRFAQPFRVDHYKWTDGLVRRLERRVATEGVSPAGKEYGERLLAYFARNGGIDLADVALAPRGSAGGASRWRRQVTALRRQARVISLARGLGARFLGAGG